MSLAANRFHGTGLFPRDLGADLGLGHLPAGMEVNVLDRHARHDVSRLLPLALLAFLVWQVFAFAHRRAGTVVAALLVLHCPLVIGIAWSARTRARFGMPLVAFLRYASEKRRGATALVLVAQAAFYPSVLLVCAPAWAVLMLVEAVQQRRKERAGSSVGWPAARVLPALVRGYPRIGCSNSLGAARAPEAALNLVALPLIPHRWCSGARIFIPLLDNLPAPLGRAAVARVLDFVTVILAALAFGICVVACRSGIRLRLAHYRRCVRARVRGGLSCLCAGPTRALQPPPLRRTWSSSCCRRRTIVPRAKVGARGCGDARRAHRRRQRHRCDELQRAARDWEARRNATVGFLETLAKTCSSPPTVRRSRPTSRCSRTFR